MLSKFGQLAMPVRIALFVCALASITALVLPDKNPAIRSTGSSAATTKMNSRLARAIGNNVNSADRGSKALAAQKRIARRGKASRATSRARAERKRSRTAYRGLSAEQASVVVARSQPQALEVPAWKPPALENGAKVETYLNETHARIDMPGNQPDAFVESTKEPLALPDRDGRLRPIDLTLKTESGAIRPARTHIPLSLPSSASGAVVFGGASGQVRLMLGSARADATLVEDGSKAFYANTDTDTDTIAEALPLGAEISWALRSPAAPESLPLEFGDTASEFKLLADGGASFDAGPLGEGTISAPTAWDAQGKSVEAKLVTTRRGVVVRVGHKREDLAYPVIVDPAVSYSGVASIREDGGYDSSTGTYRPATNVPGGPTAFAYSTSNAGKMEYLLEQSGSGYRMKLRVKAGTTGSWFSNLAYDAPRTSTIYRVDFSNVNHTGPLHTDLRIGIINSGGAWESQRVGWYGGSCADPNGCWAGGGYFGNTAGMTDSTVSACASSSCGMGGSADNKALFQLVYNRPSGGAIPTQSTMPYVTTRGAYIYFSDYTAPSLDFGEFQNLPAAGWAKNLPNPKFRALVNDTGLGVGNATQRDGGGNFYNHASAFDSRIDGVSEYPNILSAGEDMPDGVGPICAGTIAWLCPLTYERPNTEVALQDGTHTYALSGADIVGNKTTHTYVFHTDRAGPEIDLSGRLGTFALESVVLGDEQPRTLVEDTPFVIQAFDGRRELPSGGAAPAKDNRSGVKSISAKILGANANGSINPADVKHDFSPSGPKTSVADDCDPAYPGNSPSANNSCKLSFGGTFAARTLDPGIYYFRVHAEDYAGNVTDKDFKVAVGVASLSTVIEGQASSRYVPIQVKRERGSETQATIQFRTELDKPWCSVNAPTGGFGPLVPESAPTSPVSDSVAVDLVQLDSSVTSANYVLDLDALRRPTKDCKQEDERLPDGKVYIRALMAGSAPAAARASEDVTIRFEHGGLGTENATENIGPGTVDLVTGNLSISDTDVSVDAYMSDLTVSRTYNSRYSTKSGPLGPGWDLSVESESAGSSFAGVFDNADVSIPEDERYPTVDVELGDGNSLAFELTSVADVYRAENGSEALELQRIPDAADSTRTAGFKIHDRDSGTVTSFKPKTGTEEPGYYELDEVYQPGTSDQITYAYKDQPGLGSAVRYAFAPAAGLACRSESDTAQQSFDNLLRGCQALRFNYGPAGGAPSRLTSIDMKAWDPATSQMKTTPVSQYVYDSYGRLIEQWDPRITPALKTTYGILNASDPRISSVTPPGETPFVINYLKFAEDPGYGRISSIQRTPTGGTTATWTTRFMVPTQGAGAPFDFSIDEVSRWGQAHPPFIGAAVFPPDQPPNGTPATNYNSADMTYMDPLGREVNVRATGGRITTTEYNKYGEVVRALSAENRAKALAEASPALRIAAAQKWDTENEYAAVPGSLNARRHLTRTVGPEHQIRLDDGTWTQARAVTDFTYDEGSPIAGDNTKEPFDLVTTQKQSAMAGGTLHGTRTTKTSYGTTEDEWKLRIARLITTDPSGLDIKQKVTVDTKGNVTERFQPSSQNSNAPSTTKFVYYAGGIDTQSDPCDGHPEWLGLVCQKGPGVQPTTANMAELPVTTITSYNYLRQPLESSESVRDVEVGGARATRTRTTTRTYDLAGRPQTEHVTGGLGTALEKTEHVYSVTTGREVQTRTINNVGTPIKTITRAFDSLGRQTNYNDGAGHASSVTYDILDRPSIESNEKSTRTNIYNPETGDLTSVIDSVAGTFTGVYDSDGKLLATAMPGGVVKSNYYDESGSMIWTGYFRPSGCEPDCLFYQNSGVENAHGQFSYLIEDAQGQDSTSQFYNYDAAGRLIRAQDIRTTSGTSYCTQREYTLDVDSNRTERITRPETAGYCASSGGTTQTNTFDDADRMTNAGYTYDAFGRITSAPGTDTGGTGTFQASYYANDLARSITQDGTTQTLDLDAQQRMSVKTKTVGASTTVETYAYTDDSDSPAFTQTGSAFTRVVDGVAGGDMTYDSAAGLRIQITNLRGDTVAQSTTAGVLSNLTRVDEFGVPKAALPSGAKYAFHGSKQREALTSGGMIAMGVRLYQPQMGRFMQVDPVLGGTENPYGYPSDPVNNADLDGRSVLRLLGRSLANAMKSSKASRFLKRVGIRFAIRAKAGVKAHTPEFKRLTRNKKWRLIYQVGMDKNPSWMQRAVVRRLEKYFTGNGASCGAGCPFSFGQPGGNYSRGGMRLHWHDSSSTGLRTAELTIPRLGVKVKFRFNPFEP